MNDLRPRLSQKYKNPTATSGNLFPMKAVLTKNKDPELLKREGAHMNIGIIGAGHIGGTLVRRFSALGHKVFVANSRGPDTLAALASETGATPVSIEEAAHSGEVVVVTIPLKNISQLPPNLFKQAAKDATVIDTCNYYPQQRDGRINTIENGMPESRYVEQQLKHPVIKA